MKTNPQALEVQRFFEELRLQLQQQLPKLAQRDPCVACALAEEDDDV